MCSLCETDHEKGICGDCGLSVSHPEAFDMCVIPNALWLTIAQPKELLCTLCMEDRLGREITPEDFPDGLSEIYRQDPGFEPNAYDLKQIPVNRDFFRRRGWKLPDAIEHWAKHFDARGGVS